jgi:hypothetical protein
MSFNAGEILGHLRLDRSGFTAGMLEAQGLTSVLGTSISAFLANPLLGVASAVKSAVGGLKDMIVGFANAGEQIGKMSAVTGASVEFLSAFKHAANLADVSMDEVGQAFNLMNRDIAGGGKDITDLGVALTDAGGQARDTGQIFLDVADAIAKMPDPARRTGAAMDIFGRSAGALIPLLRGGRAGITDMMDEAERLGLVMSGSTAQGANAFNDSLKRLQAVWDGFANSVLPPLMEALTKILEGLVVVVERLSEAWRSLFGGGGPGASGKNAWAPDDSAGQAMQRVGGAASDAQRRRQDRLERETRAEIQRISDDQTFSLRRL